MARKLLAEMVPDIRKTSDVVQEITAASQEQSAGVGQRHASMPGGPRPPASTVVYRDHIHTQSGGSGRARSPPPAATIAPPPGRRRPAARRAPSSAAGLHA